MNRELVKRIADAVLYEGYILYPYRPSVKNRQRWTFGGLYPEAYCRTQTGADASSSQTECLIEGGPATVLEITVRFLHLTARVVGEFTPPLMQWSEAAEALSRPVDALRVGERLFHTWQEAEERQITLRELDQGHLAERPQQMSFAFPGRRWCEPLPAPDGTVAGVLLREQQPVEGVMEVSAVRLEDELFRLTLRVVNRTSLEGDPRDRDAALLRTLVSTHTILGVEHGAFVSLLDPPEPRREAAAACRNAGTWPILVGEEGQRDTMLSSPIILYDYPQLAPESPGDLFDATEIDEILTLRILTLTDEEKQSMAAVDERARALLHRTEALDGEHLRQLHGTIRALRPVAGGPGHD